MRRIHGFSITFLSFCALSMWSFQVGVHAKPIASSARVSRNTQTNSNGKIIRLLRGESVRPVNQTQSSSRIRFGRIPTDVYPIAEPVVVDYLDDEPSRMRERGELIGPYPMSYATVGIATGGGIAVGGCSHDIECDDGHPCTLDQCDLIPGAQVGTGKCLNLLISDGDAGDCDDGEFCNGAETCQGLDGTIPGICTSGMTPCDKGDACDEYQDACVDSCTGNEAICDSICVGGTKADQACTSDGDCPGGACKTNTCAPKTCNDNGVCIPGDNPCGPSADCLIRFCGRGDLNACTVSDGCRNSPCITDEECRNGNGEAVNNACQDGTLCYDGRCCTEDTEDEGNWDCRKRKFGAQCSTGIWFAGDGGRVGGTVTCDPLSGGCPKYSGGIAPPVEFLSLAGPISDSSQLVPNAFNQGTGPGTPLNKLGDDYQLTNHPSFIALELVRFVGRINEPGDILIEFYDESGFLIEDIIHRIDNTNLTIQLVRLTPPLTIPSKGYVVVRAAAISTPNIRFEWATIDTPNVGINDPDVLWVNGGLQGGPNASMSNFLPGPGVLAFEIVGVTRDKVSAPLGACCDSTFGTCDEKIHWVCKGEGNLFSGIGTVCAVCGGGSTKIWLSCRRCSAGSTNAGDPCTGDEACDNGTCVHDDSICKTCDLTTTPVCDDNSDNPDADCSVNSDADCPNGSCIEPGSSCSSNADCNDGACVGTCEENPVCITGACCDPNDMTGDGCTAGVLPTDCEGGLCDESSIEAGTFCEADSECTGGLCEMFFQGFGQDCQPNCCRQSRNRWRDPEVEGPWSGGDSCEDAFVHQIQVPPSGSNPITITISGDSSNATSTFENPDTCFGFSTDSNADRGWWEAINIDNCAYVWWDICCTSCEGGCNPGYLFMYDSCYPESQSCPTKVKATGCPISGGLIHCTPSRRGLPLCEDNDNITVFFGPLRAGTYYIPFDARPQSINGPYQMHVTVQPCPAAACCVNNEDNTASNCSLMNQIECDDADGYFLGPPNRFPAIISCPVDLCDKGSCCTGPGQCRDLVQGQEMTIAVCNANQPEPGLYVGGIKCYNGICSLDPLRTCFLDADDNPVGCAAGDTCTENVLNDGQIQPCPACEIESIHSCQKFDGGNHYNFLPSDLGMAGKISLADDFIPDGDILSAVCVWGFYLAQIDFEDDGANPDCADIVGSTGDKFRVRVYENSVDDVPGNLVGQSFVSILTKGKVEGGVYIGCDLFGPCIDTYAINMVLDTPIIGMQVDGRTYWIEVVNDLSDVPDCNWWWWQLDEFSSDGNNYSAVGSNGVYGSISASTHAQAFCLDVDFVLPIEPEHPCCKCSDGLCDIMTLAECKTAAGNWRITENLCENVTCEPGPPVNDSCSAPIEITETPFIAGTNNFCADTDGFNPIQTDFGMAPLGNDIWYTYTPFDDCDLTASMCATGVSYDSIIAVYSYNSIMVCDDSSSNAEDVCLIDDDCDGGSCVHKCPCPTDQDTHLNTFIEASDEGCSGDVIGGAGFVQIEALADVCYTIRVGGWAPGDSKGIGVFIFSCPSIENFPDPVLPDPDSPGGLACGSGPYYGQPCMTCTEGGRAGELCLVPDDCKDPTTPHPCEPNNDVCGLGFTCGSNSVAVNDVINIPWPKNRYIGFMPPLNSNSWISKEIAIRVTLEVISHCDGGNDAGNSCLSDDDCDQSGPVVTCRNSGCNGEVRWVGEPDEFCEGSTCITFMAAPLVADPVFVDWSAIGNPIQIYGEEITPGSKFLIQAIDSSNSGALDIADNYSNPLHVSTAKWGDVVAPLSQFNAAKQPDINDVLALVGKWLSKLKPLKAISQLQPGVLTPANDVSVDDVLKGVNAWLSATYPFSVTDCQ